MQAITSSWPKGKVPFPHPQPSSSHHNYSSCSPARYFSYSFPSQQRCLELEIHSWKPQLEARALPSPLLRALLQELCQYQKSTDNDGCAPLFPSHQTQLQPEFGIQLQKTITGWNIAALRHYRDRQQSDQERNRKSSYKVSTGTKGKLNRN